MRKKGIREIKKIESASLRDPLPFLFTSQENNSYTITNKMLWNFLER